MMKQLPVFPHPVTHALMWGDLGKGKGEVKAAKLLVDGGWNGGGWGVGWVGALQLLQVFIKPRKKAAVHGKQGREAC